jgi:hypothetical protein
MLRVGFKRHIKTDDYLCGFAAALAAFHRLRKQPETVAAVMKGERIDYQMLKDAAVDIEDLTEIELCIRER